MKVIPERVVRAKFDNYVYVKLKSPQQNITVAIINYVLIPFVVNHKLALFSSFTTYHFCMCASSCCSVFVFCVV